MRQVDSTLESGLGDLVDGIPPLLGAEEAAARRKEAVRAGDVYSVLLIKNLP
jgi:hypothetical protein